MKFKRTHQVPCGLAGFGVGRRRCASAGSGACAVRSATHAVAGGARAVHTAQRAGAEAGSDSFDNFVAAFRPCESHVMRTDRVNVVLHERHSQNSQTHNSHSTLARSLHDVHVARCVQNSLNSLGDGVVRARGVCVLGGTKAPSMSTRSGVRRSAVCGSAHTQQTPLKMHVETWAGLLCNQGPEIFREVEIIPGCAAVVARPSCPDHSPEPPGPGRIIRNMLGWSLEEKTVRSGVWLFRGAPRGESTFFPFRSWRLGRTTQRGRSPVIPHALVRMRTGEAPLSGHVLESGVGHCSPACGGLSHP